MGCTTTYRSSTVSIFDLDHDSYNTITAPAWLGKPGFKAAKTCGYAKWVLCESVFCVITNYQVLTHCWAPVTLTPTLTLNPNHTPVTGGLRAQRVSTILDQSVVRGLAHQHAVTVSKRRFSVGVVPRYRVGQLKFGFRCVASSWGDLFVKEGFS